MVKNAYEGAAWNSVSRAQVMIGTSLTRRPWMMHR